MAKVKIYCNQAARRCYLDALGIQIDAISDDKEMAVKAELLKIKADAMERGGQYPLRRINNGKNTGVAIKEWRKVEHLAKECFPGPRSDGWLREMLKELGLVISGGTPLTGPLTATLAENQEREAVCMTCKAQNF